MVDPFAASVAAMFRSRLAEDATYVPAEGGPIDLRVIRSSPDQIASGRVLESTIVEVQRSDVSAAPSAGARFLIKVGSGPDEHFRVSADATTDVERTVWLCKVTSLA